MVKRIGKEYLCMFVKKTSPVLLAFTLKSFWIHQIVSKMCNFGDGMPGISMARSSAEPTVKYPRLLRLVEILLTDKLRINAERTPS